MSGYNQNWRRRDRDSRSTGGRGSQNNSNFWNNNHYGNYQNYPQYSYSQQYSQQWSWGSPNQFQTSFTQRPARHVTFTPGQQQQQHGKNAQPHRLPSPGSDSSKQKSASSTSSKTPSDPHPGSEEARKKSLAQTTDKVKSCLRSFQNEKSDVLENLLSGEEETGSSAEAAKGSTVSLEAPGHELQLTPSDLKVIGMVNTSGLAVDEEDSGIPIETTEETPVAEICEMDLNNEGCVTDFLQNTSKSGKNKNAVSKEAVKSSAGSSLEAPVSDKSNADSEQPSSRAQSICQGETAHSKVSPDKKQIDSAETLLKLKQRIIQQFLKMGKNNLKDLLNNPRSRKFEFAMNHLMKEHRKVLSRELRGLAQSRIKEQESQVQSHVAEASSLLDTDVAINLSHLPQELIEQLGNLLQLNLLDNAVVSEEFQPNMAVVEEESKYNVMQNIETLQVALMSEDNIKKENLEPQQIHTADFTSQNIASETNAEEQNESMPPLQSDNEPLETVQEQTATDDQEIVHEEGSVINKARKTSSDWCPYIPLGKAFMHRGDFDSLFCEFPDFMETESAGSDEQEINLKDQSEACDEPPPAELLENVSVNNIRDTKADSSKETLEQKLMAEPETPIGESKEEESLSHPDLDLPLNPFEDLQPIIDTADKQVTAICREPNENAAEDTRMQIVPPESAEDTGSHDETTKSILDLEETLARVDKSVAGMGDDSNKQTESEGIEFDMPDAETENPCDPNDVNDDVLEGLRSIVENAKTVENVESASDMKENCEAEANIMNEEICETEAVAESMDVDVSAMSVEQCSDVLPEHNVGFVAGRENQSPTNDTDVNLNPVIPEGSENEEAAANENTSQSTGLQLDDEVMELYRCNVVVKKEVSDTDVQQRNIEEEPVEEMRHTTEIAVQTDSSEELDPLNIEKFLHCLERSGQLSPQLTKLLKEQLSSKQVEVMETEQASLSTSMMFNPAASGHVMRASRTSGNKGRTRIRSGLRSHSEEVMLEHQTGAGSIQDLGSARNALGDIGSSSVNCASRNCMNPEDILPLPVRREPTAVSKFVFLKMLEIDKDIQKLMELKLDLYRKLQVTLEMDPSTVDGRGVASANSKNVVETGLSVVETGLSVVETGLSKETVCSPGPQMVPAEESPKRQQIHTAAVTVNDADAEETSHIGRKSLPSCSSNLAPMVMLPMDYMLSHQSSQPSRQKLKTLDTSVVEAVLNSFDIPEQSPKEKELTNTNSEETPQSPSQNRRISNVSTPEVSITSGSTNKKSNVKQTANKKKTNTAKKNMGKSKGAETVTSLENVAAIEECETTKARDLRRRKPEEKSGGRNTRHKSSITNPDEDNEPLSGNRSLPETNNKLTENIDQEVETSMKIKSRRGSENTSDKPKNQRNKKEAEENASETSVGQCEESLQPKTTRNRRESRKTEVSTEEPTELEEQESRKNDRKAGEAEQVAAEAEEITNKKSRGSKQRALLAINDAFALDDSPGKNSRKRKASLNESEQEDGSGAPATRFRTRSPRKLTLDQESSQSETEVTKRMRLHGGSEETTGRRSTRTSLSESGRRNSHSEVIEEATEIKRQTSLKRKAEEALGSPEKCQRLSKPDLKEVWNMPSCFVVVHPLAEEQIRSLSGTAAEIKDNHDDEDDDDVPIVELEKKEKKKPAKKRQSSKGNIRTSLNVDVKENEPELFDVADEKQEDPLGGIPDACQPPELHSESYISAVSTPLQSPPDLMIQTVSPRTNVSIQDENSISTLVSDSVSVNSDGEHSFVRKNDISGDYKDDCDHDSLHSCDTGQELRDGTGRSLKHKSSKRHKKDIERLTFEAHQGPILDIKTVGRHVLAASEDGFVYCYSLKSGKFKRKYGGHDSAVTCLCVVECCIEPDVSSELEAGEQVTPELFFTGSLDKNLRYFSFKTGELVQPPVNIGSPIQCMDQNWGILFIGTKIGEVIQYNIKSSAIVGEEPLKIGREAILSLKATKEGPRNVLIIGTRNKPITIRDASSGLLLRSINSSWSHTVYSLVLNANEVYCGTKNGFIPVIQFQNGEQICKFRTGAGVVCMRIYNNLLFAGCYDGNIYVFSIHDKKLISCIPGPGKMLLCLDIVKNRIIVGSKDGNKLEAWGFPQDVRNHVREAKHR